MKDITDDITKTLEMSEAKVSELDLHSKMKGQSESQAVKKPETAFNVVHPCLIPSVADLFTCHLALAR